MRIRIVSWVLLFVANAVSADSGMVVARDEAVAGFSQGTYVNMWWQWAVSMPHYKSPVRDKVGTYCGVNQAGPVWFLAGGYGTSRIHRVCEVPAGKYLFFPVINTLDFPRDRHTRLSCASVKKAVSVDNEHLHAFKVDIDGHTFVNPAFYRQASARCFDLAARTPDHDRSGPAYPSATDGYWIMLRPLSEGRHRIAFRARYDNPDSPYGAMRQDIVYDLNVGSPE